MKKRILFSFLIGVIVLALFILFLKSKRTLLPALNNFLRTPASFPSSPKDNINKDQEECIGKGGEWKIAGLASTGRCFIKTKDANKPCSAKKDCEGACLAPENAKPGEQAIGKCSEYNLTLGCHSVVENGKVMPALCVD